MGNFLQIIFGASVVLVLRDACEAHPVTALHSQANHVSDHESHNHIHEQVQEKEQLLDNPTGTFDGEQPDKIRDETVTERAMVNVDEDTTTPSETETSTSGPRRKRYDEHGHSHCYGGEWRYKTAYWAHGHWHQAR